MRILVIGGYGFVGSTLLQHLLQNGLQQIQTDRLEQYATSLRQNNNKDCYGKYLDTLQLFATYHSQCLKDSNPRINWYPLDLTAESCQKDIENILQSCHPDCIINTAAMANIKQCELAPEDAYKVNCPIGLVEAIQNCTWKPFLVHLSTDIVYQGMDKTVSGDTMYLEDVSSQKKYGIPLNVYGKSKLEFDTLLLEKIPDQCIILRCSNILGPSLALGRSCAGPKFLEWLDNSIQQRIQGQATVDHKLEPLTLFEDEIRQYISIYDVIDCIIASIKMFEKNEFQTSKLNVIHLGGPQLLNRLQVADALLCAHDWHDKDVSSLYQPILRKTLNLGYQSPLRISLSTEHLKELLGRSPLDIHTICRLFVLVERNDDI